MKQDLHEFCAPPTSSAGMCFYAFRCLNNLAYGHCKPHKQVAFLLRNDEKSQLGLFVCAGAMQSRVLKETDSLSLPYDNDKVYRKPSRD